MGGNIGYGKSGVIMESPDAAYCTSGSSTAQVGGLGMAEFIRSFINGSGEPWPDVAILRPGGRVLVRRGEDGARESAFVEMDVGVLGGKGAYDVRSVKVPWENYIWEAMDGTRNKLMDYVIGAIKYTRGDAQFTSLNELYGTGTVVKVFDV